MRTRRSKKTVPGGRTGPSKMLKGDSLNDASNAEGQYIRSLRRATLPQEIVNSIADLITNGIWKPGDMIPTEKELAARFGVGRSTIREAVKSLVVMGVLEACAGEGSFVREPTSRLLSDAFRWGLLLSERNLHDFLDVRMLIEGECAWRAAQAPEAGAVDELFEIHHRMVARQNDHAKFIEWDNRLHICIAEMAHNKIFTNIATTIQQIVRAWYPVTYSLEGTKVATVREHLRIAKAIKAADPSAARDAMTGHLQAASFRLQSFLQQRGRAAPSRSNTCAREKRLVEVYGKF